MEWSGKRVLVLGAGRTGRSAAAYLASRGAGVVVADEGAADAESPIDPAIEWRWNAPFPSPRGFDLVVPSPGVAATRYADARAVLSDVEIAAEAIPAPIVAVTGSNGKTTTVLLLEAMFRAAGLRARAAGNVGVPALDLVGQPLDVAVFEVSSFQLEACQRFRPRVAVALNLAPDHLDRHGTFSAYAAAKARLFAHQRAEDFAVLNGDDPATVALAEGCPAGRRLFYTRSAATDTDAAWIESGTVHCIHKGERMRLACPEAGGVAAESFLAGALCCSALGIAPDAAADAWPGFRPPPHRREPVAEIRGVRFVNDSKATNPSAAQHALLHSGRPTLWIAGGRDKGDLDLESLFETAALHTRAAVWYGEVAERLDEVCAGRFASYRERSLEAAVRRAAALAEAGDTVLLSPAFASFDQFRGFEERGECFRAEVMKLADGGLCPTGAA